MQRNGFSVFVALAQLGIGLQNGGGAFVAGLLQLFGKRCIRHGHDLHGKDGGKLDITEDMLRTMEIMRRYFEREA